MPEPSDLAKRIADAVHLIIKNVHYPDDIAKVISTSGLAELESKYNDSTEAILRANDLALHLRTKIAELETKPTTAERERNELMLAVKLFLGSDEDGQERYNDLCAVYERLAGDDEGREDGN